MYVCMYVCIYVYMYVYMYVYVGKHKSLKQKLQTATKRTKNCKEMSLYANCSGCKSN